MPFLRYSPFNENNFFPPRDSLPDIRCSPERFFQERSYYSRECDREIPSREYIDFDDYEDIRCSPARFFQGRSDCYYSNECDRHISSREYIDFDDYEEYQAYNPYETVQQLNQDPQVYLPRFQATESAESGYSENMYRERGNGDIDGRYRDRSRDRNKFNRGSGYFSNKKENNRKQCFKVIPLENGRNRGRAQTNKENASTSKKEETADDEDGGSSKTDSNKTKQQHSKNLVGDSSVKSACEKTKCSLIDKCDNVKDKLHSEIKCLNKTSENAYKGSNKSETEQSIQISNKREGSNEIPELSDTGTDTRDSETIKASVSQLTLDSNSDKETKDTTESNESTDPVKANPSDDVNCSAIISCHDRKVNDKTDDKSNPTTSVDKTELESNTVSLCSKNTPIVNVETTQSTAETSESSSEAIILTKEIPTTGLDKTELESNFVCLCSKNTPIVNVEMTQSTAETSKFSSEVIISTKEIPTDSSRLDTVNPCKGDLSASSEKREDKMELCHPLPSTFPIWEQLPEKSQSSNTEIDSDQETVCFDDFITIDKIDTTRSYLENLDPAMDDYRVVDMVMGTPSPIKRKSEGDDENILSKKKKYDHLYFEINSDQLLNKINEVVNEDKHKIKTSTIKGVKVHRSKSLNLEPQPERVNLTKSKSLECISSNQSRIDTHDFDLRTNLLLLLGGAHTSPEMEVDHSDGIKDVLEAIKETKNNKTKGAVCEAIFSFNSVIANQNTVTIDLVEKPNVCDNEIEKSEGIYQDPNSCKEDDYSDSIKNTYSKHSDMKKGGASHSDNISKNSGKEDIGKSSTTVVPQADIKNAEKEASDKGSNGNHCEDKQTAATERTQFPGNTPSNNSETEMTLRDYRKTVDVSKKSPPKINLAIDMVGKVNRRRNTYSKADDLLIKKMHLLFGSDDFYEIKPTEDNKSQRDENKEKRKRGTKRDEKYREPDRNEPPSKKPLYESGSKQEKGRNLEKNRNNSDAVPSASKYSQRSLPYNTNTNGKCERSDSNKKPKPVPEKLNKNKRYSVPVPTLNSDGNDFKNNRSEQVSPKNGSSIEKTNYRRSIHVYNRGRRNSLPITSVRESDSYPSKSAYIGNRNRQEKGTQSKSGSKTKDSNCGKKLESDGAENTDRNRRPSLPACSVTGNQLTACPEDTNKLLKWSTPQNKSVLHGDQNGRKRYSSHSVSNNETTFTKKAQIETKLKQNVTKDYGNANMKTSALKDSQSKSSGREHKGVEEAPVGVGTRTVENISRDKLDERQVVDVQKEKPIKLTENGNPLIEENVNIKSKKESAPKDDNVNNIPTKTDGTENTLAHDNVCKDTQDVRQEESTSAKKKLENQQNLSDKVEKPNLDGATVNECDKNHSIAVVQSPLDLQPRLILYRIDSEIYSNKALKTSNCSNNVALKNIDLFLKSIRSASYSEINYEKCVALCQERFPMRLKGRRSTVEDECCDNAVVLDDPDIRDAVNIVKEPTPSGPKQPIPSIPKQPTPSIPKQPTPSIPKQPTPSMPKQPTPSMPNNKTISDEKESEDVIEIKPEIPIIDLTDDVNDIKGKKSIRLSKGDVKIVNQNEREVLNTDLNGANNSGDETITLYRSDETLNGSLEVQATVASISSKVLNNNGATKTDDMEAEGIKTDDMETPEDNATRTVNNISKLPTPTTVSQTAVSSSDNASVSNVTTTRLQVTASPLVTQTVTSCLDKDFQHKPEESTHLLVEKAINEAIKQRKLQEAVLKTTNEQQINTRNVRPAGEFFSFNSNDQPRGNVQTIHASGTFLSLNELFCRAEGNCSQVGTESTRASTKVSEANTVMPPSSITFSNLAALVNQKQKSLDFEKGANNENQHAPIMVPNSLSRTEGNLVHPSYNLTSQGSRRAGSGTDENFFSAGRSARGAEDGGPANLDAIAQNPRRTEMNEQIGSFMVAQNPKRTEGTSKISLNSAAHSTRTENGGQNLFVPVQRTMSNEQNFANINQNSRQTETAPTHNLKRMNGPPMMHDIKTTEIMLILKNFLIFFHSLKKAQHTYIEELYKLINFSPYHVKEDIKLFEELNARRSCQLSKMLLENLRILNLLGMANSIKKAHTLIEMIFKSLENILPGITLQQVFLMLDELMQPELEHYKAIPFLNILYDAVMAVTIKLKLSAQKQRIARGVLSPQQRGLVEWQINKYNEICLNQAKLVSFEKELQIKIKAQHQMQSTIHQNSVGNIAVRGEPQDLLNFWKTARPGNADIGNTDSGMVIQTNSVHLINNCSVTTNNQTPPQVTSTFTPGRMAALTNLLTGNSAMPSRTTKRAHLSYSSPSREHTSIQPSKRACVDNRLATNSKLIVHSNIFLNPSTSVSASTVSSTPPKNISQNHTKTQESNLEQYDNNFKIRLPFTMPYNVAPPSSSTVTTAVMPNPYSLGSPAARGALQSSPTQNNNNTHDIASNLETVPRPSVNAPVVSVPPPINSPETCEQPDVTTEQENSTKAANPTHGESNVSEAEQTPSTSKEGTSAAISQPLQETQTEIETIDLTWMDSIDPEQLQKEIEFITVKKENPADVEKNSNGEPFAVGPSPAESGISKPPPRVEYNEQVFTDRTCICGKRAEYICGCMMAMYCSEPCQLDDWRTHKEVCLKHSAKNSNKDVAQNQTSEADRNKKK